MPAEVPVAAAWSAVPCAPVPAHRVAPDLRWLRHALPGGSPGVKRRFHRREAVVKRLLKAAARAAALVNSISIGSRLVISCFKIGSAVLGSLKNRLPGMPLSRGPGLFLILIQMKITDMDPGSGPYREDDGVRGAK